MAHIDKDALVTEIERLVNNHDDALDYEAALEDVRNFIDSLQKEPDWYKVNPITASDIGIAEEIIVNLKRVEQDYRIDLTKEMEWLRNKVKKGE